MKENYIFQNASGQVLPIASENEYLPHSSTRYINVTEVNAKALPELYKSRDLCCGCSACYASCTSCAIIMLPDEEGFLYPVVDALKCIRCYKCMNVCAFKIKQND